MACDLRVFSFSSVYLSLSSFKACRTEKDYDRTLAQVITINEYIKKDINYTLHTAPHAQHVSFIYNLS